ncbi:LrgB-like family-domain-containing protein [Usnea florida]
MAGINAWLHDAIETSKLVWQLAWRRSLAAWIYVPIGLSCVLLACWGVDSLIGLSSVPFPASVTLLIVLFFALIICETILGDRRTKKLVHVIDTPAGFALRYINVFFTPSFVLLPLSEPVSGVEVGKIIAVFLAGFVVMFATTAYFTRGLQLLLGGSKRAIIERAEEMGAEDDEIPLTQLTRNPPTPEASSTDLGGTDYSSSESNQPIAHPPRTQDPSQVRVTNGPPQSEQSTSFTPSQPIPRQDPLPPTRPQTWATLINKYFDPLTYTLLFLLLGLPIYYSTSYTMPAHLTLSILTYFAALSLPLSYKRIIHPVLLSSSLTILLIWLLALTKQSTLHAALSSYSTKTRYIQLFSGEGPRLPPPGAGDVFSSILDVSIVALALPMFQYRLELKRHFPSIVLPNLLIATASLFAYPPLCHALGISPPRALSFASRSLTLALATPATQNLRGDLQLVAVLCIMSGVMGVLVGPALLRWMRVPEDDYVTRGVTLGGNSSAIATALLLVSDPRAAALSSLSMSMFGTVMVGLTSVPVVAGVVGGLAGLGGGG